MAQYTLCPLPRIGIASGSGYKLYTYEAGTSDAAVTYSDDAGTANANPVVANAAGLFGAIYLPVNTSFKFILKTDADVTIWTQDGIQAVPSTDDLGDVTGTAGEDLTAIEGAFLSDGSGGQTAGRWYKWDSDNTYSSIYPQIAYPTAAIASGASGTFRQIGRTTGLSGLTPGTVYYISATAGAITSTAPANARAVGVADTSTSLVLYPQPTWTTLPIPTIQTTTSTGTVDDFAITSGPTALLLRCNNATALTLTGFATPAPGKRIELVSVGAGAVTLSNVTGSAAANQIVTGSGANLALTAAQGRATLVYDGTTAMWRVINYTAGSAFLIQPGVLFPATQVPSTDANCLDDYEEGTWTPVIGGSGGTSGQGYATQVGTYLKVGQLVYASYVVQISTEGTITTDAQIQGLPFTVANISQSPVQPVRFTGLATNWVDVNTRAIPNTTAATLEGAAAAAAGNGTALSATDIQNNVELRGTIIYRASA